MSRHTTPDHPHPHPHSSQTPSPPSSPTSSPIEQPPHTPAPSAPSSSSPHLLSSSSDGYPSWLPRRPPPPAPASTFHSSIGAPEPGPPTPGPTTTAPVLPFFGGRKPTPRSVRIVSLQDSYAAHSRREPTDQTRVGGGGAGGHPRVWSRATGPSPAVFASGAGAGVRAAQPRFRARGVHVELLRSPGRASRVYFWAWPVLVFGHVPVQTFFDFNAVFMLLQVSKFPNPQAPGVPGSGRNWALGAAAYIACWLVWLVVVVLVYEVIFSFARRWRIKRPLMLPIYLSAPSFNLVALTSYSNFCFLQHIRRAAFRAETGGLRDGLAETFYFYSQNLPTVALLLPRAGLALALLLAFSSPVVGMVGGTGTGRDGTFFRREDGALTNYARGVLVANAAWTAWRALVLLASYIGLWVLSGHGCAGLCGPRHRWEEDHAEKTRAHSYYSDAGSEADVDALPWSWREATRGRVQDAHDFCVTGRGALRWDKGAGGGKKAEAGAGVQGGEGGEEGEEGHVPFEGVEQVLAAVGFPSVPPPARRGVLSGELFEPKGGLGLGDIIPGVGKMREQGGEGGDGPRMALPYPFTARGAQVSSEDRVGGVPFPPSPVPGASKRTTPRTSARGTDDGDDDDDDEDDSENDDDDDDDVDDDEEDDEEEDDDEHESEEPSTGRASGSMSSLGQPVTSRYPFQFRRPPRGATTSLSSGAPTSHSHSHSRSGVSQATQSTGNRESTDSHAHSPRSLTSASDLSAGGGIPMPPRHPQGAQGRGRPRAGTVPAPVSVPVPAPSSPYLSSPTSLAPPSPSIAFPRARAHTHTHTHAGGAELLGPAPYGSEEASDSGHSAEEASHEAAERGDTVGLLSAAPSPRTSLRHRGSGVSARTNSHSGASSASGSSRSRSRVGSSSGSVRSRAQSLIQGLGLGLGLGSGAHSHSSLELGMGHPRARSRANSSMARLEEDPYGYSSEAQTHSRSGSGSVNGSGQENWTFGHPPRVGGAWPARVVEEPAGEGEGREVAVEVEGSVSGTEVFVSAVPSRVPSEADGLRAALAPSSASTSPSLSAFPPVPASSPPLSSPPPSAPISIPIITAPRALIDSAASSVSPPGISTAAGSFVTAPATVSGTTESSGRTGGSWGGVGAGLVDRVDEGRGGAWRPA